MQISSNDASFQMEIAGDYLGHSITVPSHLHTINISPKLPKTLTDYRGRIHISLVQNNQIKLKHHEDMWTSVALSRGTHIRVTMTANVSMPEARVPEYKTRAYHLFINQS
ncbi:hypothetical protein K501DRAFT_264631 [Backusella circina FSU 941]|nr:hypothetical protein K501DRAFT_264631 [Backusella circina FSU 941]